MALITGSLIFLGYCRYHFYYATFDISIYNYITTSELLLSFLPIVVQYFIPIGLLVYLVILHPKEIQIVSNGKNYTKRRKTKEDRRIPIYLLSFIFNKRLKNKTKFKIFISSILHPFSIFFLWLIWGTVEFWLELYKNPKIEELEGLFYLLTFVWLVFILEPIFSHTFSGNKFLIIKMSNYFLILTLFIYLSQKIEAIKKIDNTDNSLVTIITNSKELIKSDCNFIFIGRTNEYTFFRLKKEKTNFIIRNSEIFTFQKNEPKSKL